MYMLQLVEFILKFCFTFFGIIRSHFVLHFKSIYGKKVTIFSASLLRALPVFQASSRKLSKAIGTVG